MRLVCAILLTLSLASYAAADDADVLRLLIKIREQSSEVSVPCDAQASQMAKCPCNCADCTCGTGEPCGCKCKDCTCVKKLAVLEKPKAKAAPQYRTVNYPAEYRTVEYTQKICHGPGRPCTYHKRTYHQLVRPARTERVRVDAPSTPVDASLPADQQPAPMEAVGAGLRALNPQPGEVLVDYGCGFDARWLITAVRLYGTQQAVGIEIDPEVAASARRYVEKAGYSDRIRIITGDSVKYHPYADIGVAYLWPETLEKLKPQIGNLRRFVSFGHAVPGLNMRQSGDIYIYERPAPQPVQRQPVMLQKPAAAVWNGRLYSGRVCNNPRCSMCNAIQRQLSSWN